MKILGRIGVMAVLITLAVAGIPFKAQADSLWTSNSTSLYGHTAPHFKVGDLVTIIVSEQATATQNAESSNAEASGVSAGPGVGSWKTLIPLVGADWDSDYKGKGATTRRGSLTAKLTVEVKEVAPNGILTLEGRQVIQINAEDQILTVKGKVRSEDVSPDNIVLSTNVADAVIEYRGKGSVGGTQSPGIITRFFQWLL